MEKMLEFILIFEKLKLIVLMQFKISTNLLTKKIVVLS